MERYPAQYGLPKQAIDPRYQHHYEQEDSEEEAHGGRVRNVARGGAAAARARGRGRAPVNVRGGGRVGGRAVVGKKRTADSDAESEEEDSEVPDENEEKEEDDEDEEDEAVEVRKVVEQVRAPNKRQVKVPKHLLED